MLVGAFATVAAAVVPPLQQQEGRVQWVSDSEQGFVAVVLFGLV